jgi:predicted nucleic acid-binding protein
LSFVEDRGLMGKGLGWIDVHLLAATALAGAVLWTADRRLAAAASNIGAGFEQH